MDFTSTHNLSFESAPDPFRGYRFRVGTCEGQWGVAKGCYYILSVTNRNQGNGHFDDVLEWFEFSCKRDGRNLIVLEIWNENLLAHLVDQRGFQALGNEHAIKIFNKKAYKSLLKRGNEMLNRYLKTF
jgi:hypothetical protein